MLESGIKSRFRIQMLFAERENATRLFQRCLMLTAECKSDFWEAVN